MDEVHELATPESAKGWAGSMRAVCAYLTRRKYAKLLGLTATPLVTPKTFVDLLDYFTPAGMTKRVTLEDVLLDEQKLCIQCHAALVLQRIYLLDCLLLTKHQS